MNVRGAALYEYEPDFFFRLLCVLVSVYESKTVPKKYPNTPSTMSYVLTLRVRRMLHADGRCMACCWLLHNYCGIVAFLYIEPASQSTNTHADNVEHTHKRLRLYALEFNAHFFFWDTMEISTARFQWHLQ